MSQQYKSLKNWFKTTFATDSDYKPYLIMQPTVDLTALKAEMDKKEFLTDLSKLKMEQPVNVNEASVGDEIKSRSEVEIPSLSSNEDQNNIKSIDVPNNQLKNKSRSSWKRPDLVEKRVIRALCDVAKDYFNDIAEAHRSVSNQDKFEIWDKLIEVCFPDTYKASRLRILGQV